jgi:hypothetical protein
LIGLVAFTSIAMGTPTASAQTASALVITVVDHPLDVGSDEVLRLVIDVKGDVPERSMVVVRVYDAITTRADLPTVLAGDTGPTRDRVTLTWNDLERTSEGGVQLLVPTTSGPLQRGFLRMPTAGVYPLRIELRGPPSSAGDGPVLAQTVTVVHAVTPQTTATDLGVAYIAGIEAPPAVRPDGSSRIDGRSRRALTALATVLEATKTTFSVALPPELLDALARGTDDDRVLWEQLSQGLQDHDVLATPAVSLDPSTAVRSGLTDTYTSLLRRGEDVLVSMVGRGTVQRGVHLVTRGLDVSGALLVRDLGARSVVLTPTAQQFLNLDSDVDPSLMVLLSPGSSTELPAALVDGDMARRMAQRGGDVQRQAFELVAELLVLRYELVEGSGDEGDGTRAAGVVNRRSVVLSTPDGSLADPALLVAVLDRLERTAGLRPITAAAAVAQMGVAIANGLAVEVDLPRTAGRDMSNRAEDLFVLSLEAFTVASMLSDGDPRPAQWGEQLWRLVALELSDDEATIGASRVRDLLNEVRGAVNVPSLNDVTLGGRLSLIRFKVRNEADYDVRVVVRMESAKLAFPEGQALVDLPANSTTEVEIPVEVRSNGRFPVSVTLLTPEGDVPLGSPVEFAARATALTGLGQLFTVAGGLILASWWYRNIRARRRARALERTTT